MTLDRERFWLAVDEALDARRDPSSVALVQEWIADHPDDRDALARLTQRLDALVVAAPRARRMLVPMIAAVACVVLGVHLGTRPRAPTARAPKPTSRIVSFSIEVSRESEGECTTVLSQPDHFERTETTRLGATNIVSSLESRQP
jgi:hypothetical protein